MQSGQCGNTSEYLREPVRHDQDEQAKKRLRDLIEEGLNSGTGRTFTSEVATELKRIGSPRIDQLYITWRDVQRGSLTHAVSGTSRNHRAYLAQAP